MDFWIAWIFGFGRETAFHVLGKPGMKPQAEALKARTKRFALDVLDFLDGILETGTSRRIIWQLSDAGTSVGANYRAVCRARSDEEFAASSLGERTTRQRLLLEANELTSIFAASSNTIRAKLAARARQSAINQSRIKSEI